MKASELRIGNFVTVKNYIQADYSVKPTGTKVTHIGLNKKIVYKWNGTGEEYYYSIDDCEPIPLTEEWLLKFGFEPTEKDTHEKSGIHSDVDLCVHFGHGEKINIVLWGSDPVYFNYKNMHVHQLQNLYFALTGEELVLLK